MLAALVLSLWARRSPSPGYLSSYDYWVKQHNGAEPTVSFYVDAIWSGDVLTLGAGAYRNVGLIGFGGNISSIEFYNTIYNRNNPIGTVDRKSGEVIQIVPQPVATIAPIPLIIYLMDDKIPEYGPIRNYMLLVEPSNDLAAEYGDPSVSAIWVYRGPDYSDTQTASFLRKDGRVCIQDLGPPKNLTPICGSSIGGRAKFVISVQSGVVTIALILSR